MINHLRTLLLNLQGSNSPGPNYPGEEFIPDSFRPVELPDYVNKIRNCLFGLTPDRAFMNYRVRQILGAIRIAGEESFVEQFDPRTTYLLSGDPLGGRDSIAVVQGSLAKLNLLGTLKGDDRRGSMHGHWSVSYLGGEVMIHFASTPMFEITVTPTGSPFTEPFDLGAFGLKASIEPISPSQWDIEVFVRPAWGVPELVFSLDQLDQRYLDSLFAGHDKEPFKYLRSLWLSYDSAKRLAAVAIALGLRIEERRTRQT